MYIQKEFVLPSPNYHSTIGFYLLKSHSVIQGLNAKNVFVLFCFVLNVSLCELLKSAKFRRKSLQYRLC